MNLFSVNVGLLTSLVLHVLITLAIGMVCFTTFLLATTVTAGMASRLRTHPPGILERWYRMVRPDETRGPATYRPLQPCQTRRARLVRRLQIAWGPALIAVAGITLLSSGPLAAAYLLGMSVLLYQMEWRTQATQRNDEAMRAIDDLLRWFQRGFRVDGVIFPVLSDLVRQEKLRAEIAPLIAEVVNRYHKGLPEEQALSLLQGYNVHLDSFVMVLHQAATAPPESVAMALEELRQRLRQQRKFQDKAQTNLAQVRLQFGVMRGVFFAVVLAAASTAMLRDFYTVTVNRQFLFMGIITLGMAGVAYFNQEIYNLQTQVF